MSVTTPATPALSFERLVTAIGQAHAELATQASRAVKVRLTLRNWTIGLHIAEFQPIGESLTPQLGLFVSKSLLELPKKEEMQRFIEEQLAAEGDH